MMFFEFFKQFVCKNKANWHINPFEIKKKNGLKNVPIYFLLVKLILFVTILRYIFSKRLKNIVLSKLMNIAIICLYTVHYLTIASPNKSDSKLWFVTIDITTTRYNKKESDVTLQEIGIGMKGCLVNSLHVQKLVKRTNATKRMHAR